MPEIPPIHETKPETFIIESLSIENEVNGMYEGKIIYDILKLQNKNPKYYYFKNEIELRELSTVFRNSGYRYLHLSCHGTNDSIRLTHGPIKYHIFSEIFRKKLNNRRIFISGCNIGNMNFAKELFSKNGGMYSITAPTKEVDIKNALAFWNSFYFLVDSYDSQSMKMKALDFIFIQLSDMYEFPTAHFRLDTNKNSNIVRMEYSSSNWIDQLYQKAFEKKNKDPLLGKATDSAVVCKC